MGSKSGPMIGRGGAQDALSPVMAVVAASHRGGRGLPSPGSPRNAGNVEGLVARPGAEAALSSTTDRGRKRQATVAEPLSGIPRAASSACAIVTTPACNSGNGRGPRPRR
jgi:hypothetical protein